MTRETWVRQFTQKLQQQVELEPEQIRLLWRGYCKRRFTQERAIGSQRPRQNLTNVAGNAET